jgi:hypothetical protein
VPLKNESSDSSSELNIHFPRRIVMDIYADFHRALAQWLTLTRQLLGQIDDPTNDEFRSKFKDWLAHIYAIEAYLPVL